MCCVQEPAEFVDSERLILQKILCWKDILKNKLVIQKKRRRMDPDGRWGTPWRVPENLRKHLQEDILWAFMTWVLGACSISYLPTTSSPKKPNVFLPVFVRSKC